MPHVRKRIVIVDDDASVRKALARLLTAANFEATAFSSAREFLASDLPHLPECLVLDVHMPEVSGLELQHLLHELGFEIPTVIVTGRNEPGLVDKCSAAGASAVLLKPLSKSALLGAIESAISGEHAP